MIRSLRRRYELNGRSVVITGGAGGLARALATDLAGRGAYVALLDLDGDAATAAAASLGFGDRVLGWQADVRDLQSVTEAMDAVASTTGGIDVVVAAAGVLPPFSSLQHTREEDWSRTIDINLNGVWRTMLAAAPHVIERRGHIVAVSSMVAFLHAPMLASYAASKAGVWALCDALRIELGLQGATVGSVHPVMFQTPMIDAIAEDPVARVLTNEFSGITRTLSVDQVARDVVRAIERRSTHAVTPRSMHTAALAPGIVQRIAERTSLTPRHVRGALDAEARSVAAATQERGGRT